MARALPSQVKCDEDLHQTLVWRTWTDQCGRTLCSIIKKHRFLSCGRKKNWQKKQNESKNDYSSKIDELRSMKLHGKFERDRDDKKSEKIMALAQKRKFEMGNRKFVVSSTGASLKHQLG